MIEFSMPIRTVSEANMREHWAPKAKRVKSQRGATLMCARAALWKKKPMKPPLRITLTRVAPRKLDPGNIEVSFKAIQDGVAEAIGIDDGHECLTWVYAQAKGDYSVTVRIEEEG